MTGRRLKYIIWFLNAGWSLETIGWLFDVEAADIRRALTQGADQ